MKRISIALLATVITLLCGNAAGNTIEPARDVATIRDVLQESPPTIQLGDRPSQLIKQMTEGKLRTQLEQCSNNPSRRSNFSIGHRGAPLAYPEHTIESYTAAAEQGAGIVECDVTFTKDRELVCRHSQCDLHTTTNILDIPKLAAQCTQPFQPATFDPATGKRLSKASARCCTSDLSLGDFKHLRGKIDNAFVDATSATEYMYGSAEGGEISRRNGTLLTHAESIALFKKLGVQMTPELKAPMVEMSTDFSQQDYARKMLQDYKVAGVPNSSVWPQSFSLEDVKYWLDRHNEYTPRVVYLDGRYSEPDFDHNDPATWKPDMETLADMGLRIIAPPQWVLLAIEDGKIVPSAYAREAKSAGLEIITWSFERSGSPLEGGRWYYQSVASLIQNDGDMMNVLDVLAQDVGVRAVFSDWPATVTYYANCMGLD